MNLYDLGWDASFADAFAPYEREGLIPARVAARHHGPCELLTARGRLGGMPAGRLSGSGLPAVGDWVAARPLAGERRALTAAADSGAEPVVVVNKLDLVVDPAPALDALAAVAGGVPVLAVSAATGQGLAVLDPWLSRGATVALLGSSGVGKSTLANALLGRPLLPTAATSAAGRGRHTTSRRDLVPLPCGALLLDTPGMRELQLWADEDALDATFAEIAELAGACRFGDCTHGHEPGCAVREALPAGRLAGYRKLRGELRTLAVRRGGD